MLRSAIFIIALLTLGFVPPNENAGTLILEVENVREKGGFIWVGIYDSEENFLIKEKAIVKGFAVTETGQLRFEVPALRYGSYALALFHDINGNGEMDRNLVGIPSEPFAFSQKPKSKWRVPYFKEVQFNFTTTKQILHTRLQKWWD